jgi:nicotinate-nucleotide adenylyltransferase
MSNKAAASAQPADQRVGLLGGSFDPVHRAHVALAYAALHSLQLQQVRWVPAGQPWQKAPGITAAHHRLAMLQMALANEPRFVLDSTEIERQGPSYTLDTVRALCAAHPRVQWFLIIGQDQYTNLHTWHGWQELLQSVVLAVANRPGATQTVHPSVLRQPHQVVSLPLMDVSATDVRARVAAGQDISALVPPEVARYIESHQLYRATYAAKSGQPVKSPNQD